MTYRIRFRPDAEQHLLTAAQFYQSKAQDLGSRFLAAVEKSTQVLAANPKLYPLCYQEYRRALLTGFPYSMYDQVSGNTVWVYGLFHQRQSPDNIRDSLT